MEVSRIWFRVGRRSRPRMGIGPALFVATSIVAIGLVAVTAAVGAPGVSQRRCGSFVAEDGEFEGMPNRDKITVYGSGHLSCRLATKVIEAFWDPEEGHHHHGGRSDSESWYTTDRFPGWRCYQGAGGGSCRSRQRIAGYSARNA